MDADNKISISVRNLVEFIMRAGDLDNTRSSAKELEAMRKGTKLHSKIQKSMGLNYNSEVSLKETTRIELNGMEFNIVVDGRADGIIIPDKSKSANKSYVKIVKENYINSIQKSSEGKKSINEGDDEDRYVRESKDYVIIDEIKGMLRDVTKLERPIIYHKAQAMCYAYFYAKQKELKYIAIRISYFNLESEESNYFGEIFDYEYLEKWYMDLLKEYAKWAYYQIKWQEERNKTIKIFEFPFEYREGQRELVAGVYRTIIRDKKLYLEAPTGVGKTISTVFPAVKAMGEGVIKKIFYLTAKTITRTTAEDTFRIIKNKGVQLKYVTITAKEKICCNEQVKCNPIDCPRAKGHFDRVNNAVFDLINNENEINRDIIMNYATKHNVCPFEMCLDVSLWVDAIICDYNYAFDPNVYLRRFFEGDTKQDFVFLIDEAHNLVERASEMFSASLKKEDILAVKKNLGAYGSKVNRSLDKCNKELLKFKRTCEECEIIHDFGEIGAFVIHLMRTVSALDEFLNEHTNFENKDQVLDIYFDMRHFINMYDIISDDYLIYTCFDEYGNFYMNLKCMNPARNLSYQLKKVKSSIFFSATLLPIKYYREQLAGEEEDYAVYAPSTFDKNKRIIMIANDVSTKYTRRTNSEYEKIVHYIECFVSNKIGNYMVFFPSYSYMEKIYELLDEDIASKVKLQGTNMTEKEKEEYLEAFINAPNETHIGFCVLGGVFSEGIDLKNDRLSGAVIVGTGLPMVCTEREIYRGYYDDINNHGFDYAYLYNGMNKVLQAAGRVIRTNEDIGQILLLDERLLGKSYVELFPREWFPYEIVNVNNVKTTIDNFWQKQDK